MKKIFLIIIGLCLCTALYADMNTYIIGAVSAGGSCDTQSLAISQDDHSGSASDVVVDDTSRGNQFTTTGAISLYSVSIYVDSEQLDAGESGTLTVRVGSGTDLSETYLGEATVTISNDTFASGFYEAIFASPVSLSATTQYAWIAQWSEAAADCIYIGRSATGVYADNNAIYNSTTGTWNCASSSTSFDYTFRLKKCGE